MSEPRPEKGLPTSWVVFEACEACGATVPKIKYRVRYDFVACFVRLKDLDEHFHVSCWRCGNFWEADMKGRRL